MKKKFSIRRTIILLSIILVYSCAVCFISFLAKKAVLEDLSYPSTSPLSVVLNADDGLESSEEVSVPNYYDKLERIENKAQIDEYGIFAPVTTEISAVTTAPEDDTSSVTHHTARNHRPANHPQGGGNYQGDHQSHQKVNRKDHRKARNNYYGGRKSGG